MEPVAGTAMDSLSGDVRANDQTIVVAPSASARAYIAFALSIPAGLLAVIAGTTTRSAVLAIAVAAVGLAFIVRATVRPRLEIGSEDAIVVNAIRTWRVPLQDVEDR